MSEKTKKQPSYQETALEDGEPVREYREPGTRISLGDEFQMSPLGKALIKFKEGWTVAANRRAMVMLEPASESGHFHITDQARGWIVRDQYPKGYPELIVGEQWQDIGTVQEVDFAPGDGFEFDYDRQKAIIAGAPTPRTNMFESARQILQEFEQSQPQS